MSASSAAVSNGRLAAVSYTHLIYFVAIWAHLAGVAASGSGQDRLYWLAVFLRVAVQFWLCVRVSQDMFAPERDVVRNGGLDDPDGGVLDQAPDAPWVTRLNLALATR